MLPTERAREARQRPKAALALLIDVLGGKCDKCNKTSRLQLHHVNGKDWVARKMGYPMRVKRYYEEYRQGVQFRVLCIRCHTKEHNGYPYGTSET